VYAVDPRREKNAEKSALPEVESERAPSTLSEASPMIKRTREQMNADFAILRAEVGGDSQFMKAHKIKKVRTKLPRRVMPLWTQSDEQVRKFLLTKYPRLVAPRPTSFRQLERTSRQRKVAIVYNQVLYMFYRLNMTEGEIATKLRDRLDQLNRKNAIDAVRDIVKVIRKYKPCASNDL